MAIYQKKPSKIPTVEFKPGMTADEIKTILQSKDWKIKTTSNSAIITTSIGDEVCKPGYYIYIEKNNIYILSKEAFLEKYVPTETPNIFTENPNWTRVVAIQWNGESAEVLGKKLDVPETIFTIVEDKIRIDGLVDGKLNPVDHDKGTFIFKNVRDEVWSLPHDVFLNLFDLVS